MRILQQASSSSDKGSVERLGSNSLITDRRFSSSSSVRRLAQSVNSELSVATTTPNVERPRLSAAQILNELDAERRRRLEDEERRQTDATGDALASALASGCAEEMLIPGNPLLDESSDSSKNGFVPSAHRSSGASITGLKLRIRPQPFPSSPLSHECLSCGGHMPASSTPRRRLSIPPHRRSCFCCTQTTNNAASEVSDNTEGGDMCFFPPRTPSDRFVLRSPLHDTPGEKPRQAQHSEIEFLEDENKRKLSPIDPACPQIALKPKMFPRSNSDPNQNRWSSLCDEEFSGLKKNGESISHEPPFLEPQKENFQHLKQMLPPPPLFGSSGGVISAQPLAPRPLTGSGKGPNRSNALLPREYTSPASRDASPSLRTAMPKQSFPVGLDITEDSFVTPTEPSRRKIFRFRPRRFQQFDHSFSSPGDLMLPQFSGGSSFILSSYSDEVHESH